VSAVFHSYQTPDAKVLHLLRTRDLTRYQLVERLEDKKLSTEGAVNNLLASMMERELLLRDGVLYGLSKRGAAALQLIDAARETRRIGAEDEILSAAPKPANEIPDSLRLLMMSSPVRGCASAADLAPRAPRPGSLQFLEAPSRFGNTLRYRDGRITDMAGNNLKRLEIHDDQES
jgi:hypothetical protein